jgi:hypothetical protein
LPSFFGSPGSQDRNADEAWMGLRALDIMKNGFFFFHGMNRYSGAAFPGLVAVTFSAWVSMYSVCVV